MSIKELIEVEHVAVLGEKMGGKTLELNVVSWGYGRPMLDIRVWDRQNGTHGSGISFTMQDAAVLCDVLPAFLMTNWGNESQEAKNKRFDRG